jgi:hypothetical protein
MKRYRIPIAIALFVLPVLVRGLWFYQGAYWRTEPPATPDYASYSIPQPPLSTAQPATASGAASRAIVLLDQAHNNLFSPSELESLTGLLRYSGARVESVVYGSYEDRSLADQLKYASAYISIAPIRTYTAVEVLLLQDFVRRGGRLLILTDPTRSAVTYDYSGYGTATLTADVISANTLLAPFGIAFHDDYLYNQTQYEGNYRNVFFDDFSANALTKDLTRVVFYAVHSLETDTGTVLIQSGRTTKSSRTDSDGAYPVAALDSGANVLAIGDLSFLQPPYNQVADNALLIRNLADFLLGGKRIRDLNDFPFLFERDAAIVPLADVSLTAGLLGPIRVLQENLAGVGIESTIASQPAAGKDLILLGTFSSPGIEPYVARLGIQLPSFSGFPSGGTYPQIILPGFGSLPAAGVGLILFSRTEDQSILMLLAPDPASLGGLMGVLGPQGFADCVLQGDAAVCGLGGGYGGFDDSWWQAYSTETYPPDLLSTPTPMPAG